MVFYAPQTEREKRFQITLTRELGRTIVSALENPDVVEVGVNSNGRIWLDTHSSGLLLTDEEITAEICESILATIATYFDRSITAETPLLEVELPFDGSRLAGVIQPIAPAPAFTLRKRAARIFSLADYVASGILSHEHRAVIEAAVDARENLLISGGTGSGKTTFANAILLAMAAEPGQRFVLLEDTIELQCPADNVLSLRTNPPHQSMRDLLRHTMRQRPTRIIVGEVRGGEAHDLLKAWNTGHPGGLATLHSNNGSAALLRLDHLAQEAGVPPQRHLIAETVHLVIHIERTPRGRLINEVLRLDGLDASGNYRLAPALQLPTSSSIATH